MPCLARFSAAFCSSHSKSNMVDYGFPVVLMCYFEAAFPVAASLVSTFHFLLRRQIPAVNSITAGITLSQYRLRKSGYATSTRPIGLSQPFPGFQRLRSRRGHQRMSQMTAWFVPNLQTPDFACCLASRVAEQSREGSRVVTIRLRTRGCRPDGDGMATRRMQVGEFRRRSRLGCKRLGCKQMRAR